MCLPATNMNPCCHRRIFAQFRAHTDVDGAAYIVYSRLDVGLGELLVVFGSASGSTRCLEKELDDMELSAWLDFITAF